MPINLYLKSREEKLVKLKKLYTDKSFSMEERRKWRTQYFSLKKRMRVRLEVHCHQQEEQ